MGSRILHLLDGSVCSDSLTILAQLLGERQEHFLASFGHCSTRVLASLAGIDGRQIMPLGSMGWADPSGWRALRRLVKTVRPTHVHAWGTAAIVAATMSGFEGSRLATLTGVPSPGHRDVLRFIQKRAGGKKPWVMVAPSHALEAALGAAGIVVRHVIPQAVGLAGGAIDGRQGLRARLGIAPTDGPILLHGGEGVGARQDLALWAAAVVQQLSPGTRIILREDVRTRMIPGEERFRRTLVDGNILIPAAREMGWQELLSVADVFFISATGTIGTGCVLAAMQARVPIVATPIACISEILSDGRSALIAKHTGVGVARPVGNRTIRPKAMVVELERLLSDGGLAGRLTENAFADVQARFGVPAMLEAYGRLYEEG